jgi:hypothetical protein
MPHKALVLTTAVNDVTRAPGFMTGEQIAELEPATTLADLVRVLGITEPDVVGAATEASDFLGEAVVLAIIAAYRGAAQEGNSGVQAVWRPAAGRGLAISSAKGNAAENKRGFVSVVVESPEMP